MQKLILAAIFCWSCTLVQSQDILVFKKKNKTIKNYWKGSIIAFQLANGIWQKGEITKIKNDSFQVIPTAIIYHQFTIDTIKFWKVNYSIKDVYALPEDGVHIDWINNRFEIAESGDNYGTFIGDGSIFKLGAAAYAILNISNALIQDGTVSDTDKKNLNTAAGVFAFGMLIKGFHRQTIKLGKKFYLQTISISK